MAIKILVLYGHGTDVIAKTFRSHFRDAAIEFFDYHSEDWKESWEVEVMKLDGVIINTASNALKAGHILKGYNSMRSQNGKKDLPYIFTDYYYSVEEEYRLFIESLLTSA